MTVHITQQINCQMHLMVALQTLSPAYVTTYISGAQNSNSLSQLIIVDKGALIKNGPGEWPWEKEQN